MSELDIPPVSGWLQDGFHRFLRSYLRRHFHRIGIERRGRSALPVEMSSPLILYGNHPSWWDPLIAHFVTRNLLPGRQFYAPIDAASLGEHRVFEKLGFFGVQLDCRRGAREFLRQSRAILGRGGTALWMTPEGRFTDPRNPELPLRPGLAHLCGQIEQGRVVPVAIEYVFWQQRLPECLVEFGTPIRPAEMPRQDKNAWSDLLTGRLRATQRQLADRVIARSFDPFECLLAGRTGTGGWYAAAQRIRSIAALGNRRLR